MNMFAKNDANSVEEYLLMVPADRKKDIDFLHGFIQKAVPKLKTYFASNMIGYGSFYYLDSKKQKKFNKKIFEVLFVFLIGCDFGDVLKKMGRRHPNCIK